MSSPAWAATPAVAAEQSAAAEDALDLKLRAIALVEAMRYPDPDRTPPGKDLRKEEILLALRASTDGLYRTDGFLEGSAPFEQDVKAARRLLQLAGDPHVDEAAVSTARQALDLLVQADRLLVVDLLDATGIFAEPFPAAATHELERARQELAKGDDKTSRGLPADALHAYTKAYRYAEQAGHLLFAAFDPDGDELPQVQEERLGTESGRADSDGDGLGDGVEALRTGTDPLDADTRDTGVPDGDKDVDSDGLTHLREVALGSDPLRADTDGDGAYDGTEAAAGTDPTRRDSDVDALEDGSEARLGTDPLDPDSNDNGALDGFETYTTTAGAPGGAVSVTLTGTGDVAQSTAFDALTDDVRFQDLPGQVSDAYDITVDKRFSAARLQFRFDPATVPGGDLGGLRVMYYDELAQTFLELDSQGIDTTTGTAWADTTHFSTYVLFYIPEWNAVWTQEQGGGRDDSGEFKNLDVMLTLDSSGSMLWNDPGYVRRTAAKQFIDALVEGDRAGVVDFDSRAVLLSPLTDDRPAAKAAVDRVDSWGGTNIGAGVSIANTELISRGDPEHLKAQILLTDGVGSYSSTLTEQAKAAGITIYTIGLGYDVDTALLQDIAAGTGGMYFPVSSADGLPQVFRRIADGGADLTDSDGDGLPDRQESEGIRLCTGELLKTDPTNRDTDGDGLTDLDELGQRQSVPAGTCYAVRPTLPPTDGATSPSNPVAVDSDGDGLLDADERDYGTSPYLVDTDGDTLSDAQELLTTGSDPLHRNVDGDGRDDAEELRKDTDPYYRDLQGWDHGVAAVAGFIWGDSGERAVRWHLLDRSTLESFSYLSGWLVSGYAVIGDIRDAGSSLWDGRFGDAALSAVGLVPLVGDAGKTAGVVAKFVTFNGRLMLPVTLWVSKQFRDHDTARRVILRSIGVRGLDRLDNATLDALASTRNDMKTIGAIWPSGRVFIRSAHLSAQGKANVAARVADTNLWSAADKVEAIAVETAVEVLQNRGYRILYVGRKQQPVPGTTTYVSKGPDIVAVTPGGRTVVVEAKGSGKEPLYVNNSLLDSPVAGRDRRQPTRDWLSANALSRYLGAMSDPKAHPDVQEAAQRLARINGGEHFDGIVVAAAREARVGKVDNTLEQLHDAGDRAEIITVDVDIP